MGIQDMRAAKRRWLERHPRIWLTLLTVPFVCALLGAGYCLTTREGHWVILTLAYGSIAIDLGGDARKVLRSMRAPAGTADVRDVDDQADESNRLADGVGKVDGVER